MIGVCNCRFGVLGLVFEADDSSIDSDTVVLGLDDPTVNLKDSVFGTGDSTVDNVDSTIGNTDSAMGDNDSLVVLASLTLQTDPFGLGSDSTSDFEEKPT